MLANWVFQTLTVGGAGDLTLGNAVPGYVGVSNVFSNGDSFFYTIEDGLNKETGYGHYVSSSNKVVRDQVFEKLLDGVYDNTEPTNLYVNNTGFIMVGNSVQALTTNKPVWRELVAQFIPPISSATDNPTYTTFISDIDAYHFPAAVEKKLGLRMNINNDILADSIIYPCVHWSPKDSNTGTVRWKIELSIANVNGTFTDGGVVYLEQSGGGTTAQHQRIELQESTITAPSPNAMIIGNISRDSTHVNDTYTGEAVLHGITLNYQSDRIGTPAKNSDFYVWG